MISRHIDTSNVYRGRQVVPPGILVVDDDPRICRLLTRVLSKEGYQVETAANGEAMWRALQIWQCDLVVLDLRLQAGEDGLSLARQLREESDIALIMLTGRGDWVDKVVGLEVGADDYITKPFEPRELIARIRSVLRRAAHSRSNVAASENGKEIIRFSGWALDLDRRVLTSNSGVAVELTSYEFELLAVLASRQGRVLSRGQILELVANRRWDPDDRSIDVLIGKLRHKLGENSRYPRLIKTVRGVGYMFVRSPCLE